MKNTEFIRTLDFILNRCTLREIDAVEAAVDRRRSDLASSTGMSSLDPSRLASEMNNTIQHSLEASMNGMRASIRGYAADIIKKEAPELTDSQMDELLDAWIPDQQSRSNTTSSYNETPHEVADPEVLVMMIMQFTSGALGTLAAQTETTLIKEFGGDWAAVFWKQFPPDVRKIVKARVDGKISDDQFQKALATVIL